IQVDVMDGHFVPNLTFGPLTVEAVRRATSLPIEAHLMIERPELFLEAFVKSGATMIEVQVESTTSLYRTVQTIKELGAKAGVAAGATVLVAGNSVYGYKGGVAAGIKAIREALD